MSASYEEGLRALMLADSYTRLAALIELHETMARADWLKLIGEHWSICDNVGAHRRELRTLLGTKGPLPELMDEAERRVWDTLPERLTVYRGCGPANMLGASWSLEAEVAKRFPGLHRYRQRVPLLITGSVRKERVLCVKLDRAEVEIVSFSVRRVSLEFLSRPEVAA